MWPECVSCGHLWLISLHCSTGKWTCTKFCFYPVKSLQMCPMSLCVLYVSVQLRERSQEGLTEYCAAAVKKYFNNLRKVSVIMCSSVFILCLWPQTNQHKLKNTLVSWIVGLSYVVQDGFVFTHECSPVCPNAVWVIWSQNGFRPELSTGHLDLITQDGCWYWVWSGC